MKYETIIFIFNMLSILSECSFFKRNLKRCFIVYIYFYLEKIVKSMRLKNLEKEILEKEIGNENCLLFENLLNH